ncbi:hypothetical protein CLU97_3370 [Chryseobacterium sp. 7]|uniref:hypothetical protein n=1 Tax=Chryseobacterium sp. 7 TaxID=2035214 RepID=UPI000EAD246D|nr:hypothetical protein [Chryseobacterium sp. 7]RLJ33881.1 hypothetical protein CLU97_3370 [Chryseobacterium sp. 7]
METEFIIPKGYVLVPDSWAEKYFNRSFWSDIQDPTIKEISEYLQISVEKIKKDLRNIDCPLRRSHKGKSGRGNQSKFHKYSVEEYKDWIRK